MYEIKFQFIEKLHDGGDIMPWKSCMFVSTQTACRVPSVERSRHVPERADACVPEAEHTRLAGSREAPLINPN